MAYILGCVAALVFGYMLNTMYITVFYHRGLTHGAVELAPWLRRFVIATGNWVTGLDPKGWSVMHRLHHLHSDTAKDPHSPTQFGILGVMLAQLHSYNQVLRDLKNNDAGLAKIASDLDFPISWLNRKRLWLLPYLTHFAIWIGIGVTFDAWMLGYCYFLGIMSHPIQGWMVNALGHSVGYRNFDLADDSRNNPIVALLVVGEGYQNNHHRFPNSAKFSVKWYELDMGYGLCLMLQAVGALRVTGIVSADEILRATSEHEESGDVSALA